MNPFDLSGPAFLVFYLVMAKALLVALVWIRRSFEGGPVPKLREVDPYLFAWLRGGNNEALRVGVLSLLDRGLLRQSGDELETAPGAREQARRPFEQRILEAFEIRAPATEIFSLERPRKACLALEVEARGYGLAPTSAQTAARFGLAGVTLLVLWVVATIKIDLALERGRPFGFLVILALVAPFAVYLAAIRPRTTPVGRQLIEDYQTLFGRLRDRAGTIAPGGATNELALLAGIFGISALAGAHEARAMTLFPRAHKEGSSSCGSSCGAASSCGGGGCGGGGCGGCGS